MPGCPVCKIAGYPGNIYVFLAIVTAVIAASIKRLATHTKIAWLNPLWAATTSQSDSAGGIRSAKFRCICEMFA